MNEFSDQELRRMSKVFMDSADPIIIEDLDGVVVQMNTEAEISYGWTREELIGKSILEIITPDRHGQAQDILLQCKSGESVRNIEGLRCDKKGNITPVLVTLSLLRNESGEPEGVATLAKDISDQKSTEQTLRQMSKVFMDGADPILIEDLKGDVIDLNGEAEHAYGWSRHELIGKPIKTIVPDDKHDQADELLKLCTSGEEVRNIEGERIHKDGTVIPVLLTLSLLRDDEGQATGIATFAKDISAQKQAQKELIEYQNELESQVDERTRELEKKVKQAEFFNKMSIDRELKMIELKKEINDLLVKTGADTKYTVV